jgi:hypothetical protein
MAVKKKVAIQGAGKLDLFLQSLHETYPNDPTRPGIGLAWIPDNGGKFTGAIYRYTANWGQGKYPVVRVEDAKATGVLTKLLHSHLSHINKVSYTEQLVAATKGTNNGLSFKRTYADSTAKAGVSKA